MASVSNLGFFGLGVMILFVFLWRRVGWDATSARGVCALLGFFLFVCGLWPIVLLW